MPVPKKRRTHSRTRTNHAYNFRAQVKAAGVCKNCGAPVLPHVICPVCGYYKGRKVKKTKLEKRNARQARKAEENKK
ncbi:MAG: 50S ribosomal protein L32 [Candidatus Margulisbacteria bacterium]|jgi:large subunit ribosomal protein L32|nr:50S ribosomal protein L32 [Candidatus Margulisiibacteriota bacterium]